MTKIVPMLGVMLLAFAGSAAAQSSPTGPPSQSRHLTAIEACRAIGPDAARLACFDREAAALVSASRSGELSVVNRADMRTARRSLFGFSLPKLPFFSGDKSADDVPDVLDSTIRSARPIASGRYRIQIAAGDAVWETTEASTRLQEPQAGEKIVISKGALGSYFLRINGQNGVKGRRIK